MSRRKVLVVDDDPDVVEYVGTFLRDNGFEVCAADASDTALAEMERSSVNLLIIDVMMPGRSGLDLLVKLRTDPRWCDLPIVMLTGNDKVIEDAGRSYPGLKGDTRGADEVLGKPLKPAELLEALERLGF
ncbi:MAG: response regulator [Planctomycetota bacterium]|jgi:two-component system alkaline phosphatase synthesis response regulator PhoP